MKEHFLNLNSISGRFLIAIFVFLIGLPGCGWLLERAGIHVVVVNWIIKASAWIGAGLLILFILLIILEQLLDARIYYHHHTARNKRVPLGNGYAECPACGYRQMRDFETVCPVCGKELQA